MAKFIIDQIGLPAGTLDRARTDGLISGAKITLDASADGGATCRFDLLWVPPGDTTSVATLRVTGNQAIWEYFPTPGVPGEHRIQLTKDAGLRTEEIVIRTFAIRTPNVGLVIPAFNSKADKNASLILKGPSQTAASEDNAVDYAGALAALDYTGWWRAIYELTMAVENGGGGSGAVASVRGSGGITPTTPQIGAITLSGAGLYARNGSNGAMLANVAMGGFAISNASTGTFSGALTALNFNGVALTTGGSETSFLNASGGYTTPESPVASVQGSNGITPATATTGAVTLSGAALLPLDGTRAMTGDLDLDGSGVVQIGADGLSFSGATPKISTGDGLDGVYYLPQYPPFTGGDILSNDGLGTWQWTTGLNYTADDDSRYRLRVNASATSYHCAVTLCDSSNVERGYIQWRYTDNRVILGCTSSASGLSLVSNAYEAKWPTADAPASYALLATNGMGQLSWSTALTSRSTDTGLFGGRLSPDVSDVVASLANGANANYDFNIGSAVFPANGVLTATVVLTCKLTTGGTYRRLSAAVDMSIVSSTATLLGTQQNGATGYPGGMTVTLSLQSAGAVFRVNINNATGTSAITGVLHIGWESENLIA